MAPSGLSPARVLRAPTDAIILIASCMVDLYIESGIEVNHSISRKRGRRPEPGQACDRAVMDRLTSELDKYEEKLSTYINY